MITQPGVYLCCYCKKQIDLIQTTQSIFTCCDKKYGTCISCSFQLCPKCKKQRTNKINKYTLRIDMNLSKINTKTNKDQSKVKKVQTQSKSNIIIEKKYNNYISEQKAIPTKSQQKSTTINNKQEQYKSEDKLDNNNKKHQNKQQQINNISNKNNNNNTYKNLIKCMSCQLPIYEHIQKQSQITICKLCQQQNLYYQLRQSKNNQLSLLEQRLNKTKQMKQQKEIERCACCQKLTYKIKLKTFISNNNDDNGEKDNNNKLLCSQCYSIYQQNQKTYAFSKIKQPPIKPNIINNIDKQTKQKNKQQPKQQQQIKQNNNNDSNSNKQRSQIIKVQENRYKNNNIQSNHHKQQQKKITNNNNKQQISKQQNIKQQKRKVNRINEMSLISLTTIQKSRSQDIKDKSRKYSIDQADQDIIHIQIQDTYDSSNDKQSPYNTMKYCNKCQYIINQQHGFYQYDELTHNQNINLNQNINNNKPQHQPIFLCLLCTANYQKAKQITKIYSQSTSKIK